MDLMEDEPKPFFVSKYMPPIKEKAANQPAHEAFQNGHIPHGKMED